MRANPSYIVSKLVSQMDPSRDYKPRGWGYSTAAAVRDLPFNRPGTIAALAAASSGLAPMLAPTLASGYVYTTGYAFAREAVAAAPAAIRGLERLGRRQHEFTAPMVDTQAARSMRQASLRAIHDSGYHLRSVIGAEARLMHS